MSIFSFLFGQAEEPLNEQREIFQSDPISKVGLVLPECDTLPNATGPFGSRTNPIPVNGVLGELNYLNRLQTERGDGVLYHRIANPICPISNHPIDVFELVTTDAKLWFTLHFSPFHPRRSRNVPAGFKLERWSTLSSFGKATICFPIYGVNFFVDDFPSGLPQAIAIHPFFKSIGPSAGDQTADRARIVLRDHVGKWGRPVRSDLEQVTAATSVFLKSEERTSQNEEATSMAYVDGLASLLGRATSSEENRQFLETLQKHVEGTWGASETFIHAANETLGGKKLSEIEVVEVLCRVSRELRYAPD